MEFWLGVTYTLMALALALILATEVVRAKIRKLLKEMEARGNAKTLGE